MTFKSLATATVALAMLAGPALAQTAGGNSGNALTEPSYASDKERTLWEENKAAWGGFFTDDTMSTMRSEQEVRDAFAAMSTDDQASMRAACEQAAVDSGSYGTRTMTLCTQATSK